METEYKIGSIIKHNNDQSRIKGVIIYKFPSSHLLLKPNAIDSCSFAKIQNDNLYSEYSPDTNNINHDEHSDVKRSILKFIQTRNLSDNERTILKPIISFAFPNGLPKFNSNSIDSDRILTSKNLKEKLLPSKQFILYSKEHSPFKHCNERKCVVLKNTPEGMWSSPVEKYMPSFLPFINSDAPTFYGISRIVPYTPEASELSSQQSKLKDFISNMENELKSGNIRSHINLGDERVQILPHDNYKIIIPSKYHNQRYDFKLGKCVNCNLDNNDTPSLYQKNPNVNTTENINSMFDTPYLPKNKSSGDYGNNEVDSSGLSNDGLSNDGLDNVSSLHEEFKDIDFNKGDFHVTDLLSLLENDNMRINSSDEDEEDFENSQYYNSLKTRNRNKGIFVGGKKSVIDSPETMSSNSENSSNNGSSDAMSDTSDAMSDTSDAMSDTSDAMSENDYSEMSESEPEMEFFDDEEFDLNNVEVITKVRQIPKPEGLKVFKETIQKGRIKKQMYEKLPKFQRNHRNEEKIDKLVDKISLLKTITTNKENEIIYRSIDKHNNSVKPLVEQLVNDDFNTTNNYKFIVPLVVTKRKIYITDNDKINRKEFEDNGQVVIDFYKDLELIDKEQQQITFTKNRSIIHDEEVRKNIESINPYNSSSIGTGIGLYGHIAGNFLNGYNKIYDVNGIYKLKTEIAYNRIALLNKDATVYRLGTNQFKYLNFGVQERELEEIKLLGPFTAPLYEDKKLLTREEIEELDNMIDRNIEPTTTNIKTLTTGDEYNMVGFVRPPINTIILNIIKDCIPDDIVDKYRINIFNLTERVEEKIGTGKVIYQKINKIDANTTKVEFINEKGGKKIEVEFSSAGFYLPNKYVIFSLPNINLESGNIKNDATTNLNRTEFAELLHKIVPSVEDIITYIQTSPELSFISTLTNSQEIIGKILMAFGYFYNGQGIDLGFAVNEMSNKLQSLGYNEYMYVNKNENDNLKKLITLNDNLDKLYQLKQKKKDNGKDGKDDKDDKVGKDDNNSLHRKAKIFTDDIMELTDKYYGGEPFSKKIIDSSQTKTDEFRIAYLSLQKDLGTLYSSLLKKNYLLDLLDDFNLDKSREALSILKEKYETLSNGNQNELDNLTPELKNKMNICNGRINRKPKIVRYPTLERLEEDNGKVSSTPSGDMIMEGDYALIEVDKQQENGAVVKEKQLYRRSSLHNGDYWLVEPLEALEKLLKKKASNCELTNDEGNTTDETLERKRAMMQIDNIDDLKQEIQKETISKEELQACTFDVDSIQCVPKESREITAKLKHLKAEIQDTENAIKCATVLPVMIANVNKKLANLESTLHSYANGDKAYAKFKKSELEKIIHDNAELEKLMMGSKCSHTMAFKYIESLDNISDEEYYKYMKEHIIDKYVDEIQMSKINLDEVSKEPENNFLKCNNCEGRLICKHYLYAIELMNADDDHRLDMNRLVSVYGYTDEETNYCKICGKFLNTTDAKDLEGFEGGEDGRIVRTREVVEERDVIADMKKTVSQMITKALHNTEGKVEQEDLRKKIEVFDLCKITCGLKQLIVEDDLEMISFLKSYNHAGVTRKGLKAQIYLQFLKLGRKLTDTQLSILTEQEYQKVLVIDVIVRFLVLLQTSKQQYQVVNKYFNGNYMGYPMLTTNKSKDIDGIKLCFNLAKQLSVIPKYRYLASGKSGIESIRNTINTRLDLLIENDELVRSKLQTALEVKYAEITEKEEEMKTHSYYWPEYRPHMGFTSLEHSTSSYTWTPQTDFQLSEIRSWTSTNLNKITDLIDANIVSRQQSILRGMENVVLNMEYTTKMVRDGQVCNGVALYELLNSEYKVNSNNKVTSDNKVNYYDLFVSRTPDLNKLIKQCNELGIASEQLSIIKKPSRIIIDNHFIDHIKEGRNKIQFNFDVNQGEIDKYFLKYIDNGQFKGQLHMYNDLGRCIISNILKNEKAQLTYTKHDLMTLYKFVAKSNIKYNENTIESQLVQLGLYNKEYVKETLMCGELYLATEGLITNMNMLYTMLEGNKYKKLVSNTRLQLLHKTIQLLQNANEKLKNEVFINIIEECHHNIDFQHKVSVLNVNVSNTNNTTKILIEYINNNISKLNNNDILQDNINQFINLHILFITRMIKYDYQRFDIYLYETIKIHLINNSFVSSGSSTSSKGKGNDDYSKSSMLDKINHMKSIFETNIDNTNQSLIELIINKVQLEDDKQINLITNCGDFNKLVNDNKKFMDVMNELIPDITYVNQDLLLDNNLSNIKSSFLRKCVNIINYLVSSLSNNSWDNVKNLKDINKFYYEPFIKFQDVQKNFKSYKVFITFINNVISNITLHNNDIYNSNINDIFITEDLRYSYIRLCFLYILSFLLTGHNDKIFNLDNFSNTKINKDKHTSKHIGKHTDKDTESNTESNKSAKPVKSGTKEKVKVTSDNEFSYSSKLDKKQSYVNKGGSFENNDNSVNMGNYGSLRNNNNDDSVHDNNNDSVHGNNNEINNGSIDEKMDKSLEGIDTELYPEMIVSEHYQNEPGEDVEDDEEEDTILNLIEDSLDNKQNHTHIMKQFVSDIIIYLTDIQHITSSMNNDTVEDEISKGRVTTVKETLRLNRDLSAEGMEDTRAMVNNLRMLGRLDYSNLASNYDNIMYGSGADEESNELEMDNTVPAREILGDGDRDLFAHNDIHGGDEGYYEEAVFVGVAEDMEGGDFDYGYIGVD